MAPTTETIQQRADAILAHREAEANTLDAARRARESENERAWREHLDSLPQVPFAAWPIPEPGQEFVMATEAVWAAEKIGKSRRKYLAATAGQWVPAARAEALGITGPSLVLVPDRGKAKES
jgi:hypothetical protein